MKPLIERYIYIFHLIILFIYIINVFLNIYFIEYFIGISAIIMITISFVDASKLFKILGVTFLVFGGIMYIQADISLVKLPLFLTSNMNLLAFFAVLPWINSVVHVGKYDRKLKNILEDNVNNLGDLYKRSMLVTFILVTFLNLSAINLTQNILSNSLKKVETRLRNAIISKTTLRSLCLVNIWSPMEIIVAIIVDSTQVSYLIYLPWLLLIAITVFIIDSFIGGIMYKSIPYDPPYIATKPFKKVALLNSILKLLIALSLFLFTIITVNHLFQLDFILTVTLVIIPFSTVWSIVIKRWYYFRIVAWNVWKTHVNNMQNFIVLFISLAFFSNSLKETAITDIIQRPFMMVTEYPLIIFILILFTYLIMAVLGVHPIATIGILLEVLDPLFTIFNPTSIGIVLIVGAMATNASGTFGIAVTMTSINIKQSPYRVTLINLPFTFLLISVGFLVAFLVL